MNNEHGTMFKRLMNERNELRKYIIDICELLGIDTSQSILGANCLEFYAVLSSTAENKIRDLQEQLKRKEQECKKLYIQLKADEEYHKEEENTLRKIIKNKEERNIELYKENNQLKGNDEKKTNELEKTFFDTFGIEKREIVTPSYSLNSEYYEKTIEDYPQITNRILLELICLNNIYLWETHTSTVNELKNVLLNKYIEHVNLMADENEKQEYINQVRVLFKEGN